MGTLPLEPTALSPGTPTAPAGNNIGPGSFEIEGVQSGYVYIHPPLHNAQFFNRNVNGKDHQCDNVYIPDLLTADGTSTG